MSSPRLTRFRATVERRIGEHPILRGNPYTAWFARGEAGIPELRRFTVQFSVFSHLFLEAQLRKCINAGSLESYHAGKEILLNELGVSFSPGGTIDGSAFRFNAAHFEWLLAFAQHLGLYFEEIGKRRHGDATTLEFCDVLRDVYGSDDSSEAAGASYAIEHWAAAGFWKDLIAGLRIVKTRHLPNLPLGFWTWHDALEDQHAAHTDDELAAAFAQDAFDEEAFLRGGSLVLDAVSTFWHGLAQRRILIAA